jgi:hypothetical protein
MCAEPSSLEDYGQVVGIGTTLGFTPDAGSVTRVPIKGVLDITPFARARAVATLSPLDGVQRVDPGSHTASQATARVVFNREVQDSIENLIGVKGKWDITYPESSSEIGHGFLSSVQIESVTPDNHVTASLQFNVDGKRTFNKGTAT